MTNHTLRLLAILLFSLAGIFIIDQNIKALFVDGFRYYTECIDLILVYNKGVAFSMFAFLQEYLKYIQLVLVSGVLIYVIYLRKICYAMPVGILLGGAFSNIYDRFIHEGVVDMVYWHCGFNFAVFNFADVMIDLAVVWLLILNFKPQLCKS
ncbi:signal peptidase II [Sulfurimonas paralvinellae]|uniref:Lipoprotein signal peptidase n=1 Tax=Sulfurimonas paralvinellae TaxID=317658 RepID=A0A7M1BCT9_9BACT|nr:signal peptidase II [Sulfurimonas paralvinellae]QOP46628.1 lipoprotein signal peptidase [Sulfurimonas paralvinellae]